MKSSLVSIISRPHFYFFFGFFTHYIQSCFLLQIVQFSRKRKQKLLFFNEIADYITSYQIALLLAQILHGTIIFKATIKKHIMHQSSQRGLSSLLIQQARIMQALFLSPNFLSFLLFILICHQRFDFYPLKNKQTSFLKSFVINFLQAYRKEIIELKKVYNQIIRLQIVSRV